MALSYTRVNWVNYPTTTTPVNAENLNIMDAAISAATAQINTNTTNITTLNSKISTEYKTCITLGNGTISKGGTIQLTESIHNYRFLRINISGGLDTYSPIYSGQNSYRALASWIYQNNTFVIMYCLFNFDYATLKITLAENAQINIDNPSSPSIGAMTFSSSYNYTIYGIK